MRQEDRPLVGIALVLAACTLVLTGLVARRELIARPSQGVTTLPALRWQELIEHGHEIGDSKGARTVLVFTDYQCSFCRDFEAVVEELLQNHPTGLRVVFRHFPLRTLHPHAEEAALAVECAAAQHAFRKFHQLVFRRQADLGQLSWINLASEAGIQDTADFGDCVSELRFQRVVGEDIRVAAELGFVATPTVYLDGARFASPPTLALLEDQLKVRK